MMVLISGGGGGGGRGADYTECGAAISAAGMKRRPLPQNMTNGQEGGEPDQAMGGNFGRLHWNFAECGRYT